MNQSIALPTNGHHFTRFFHCLLAIFMLAAFSTNAMAEKINLNTAGADALQYIPGIGPGKSVEIIRIRQESGGFKTMDDLLAVPGIGQKILLDIKKHGSLDSGVSTLTEEMQENPPGKKVSESQNNAAAGAASS